MSVQVTQPEINVREELSRIVPFDKSEYLTNYGSQLEGVPYTDPDAVGTNPEATLYPDGTIIGSTDNGSYTKYPNGDLTCSGIYTLGAITLTQVTGSTEIWQSGTFTIVLPMAYFSAPKMNHMFGSEVGSTVDINTMSIRDTAGLATLTSIRGKLFSASPGTLHETASFDKWSTLGRWK